MKNLSKTFQILEKNSIQIHEHKEGNRLKGYELEMWTNGGVNQCLFIDFRDNGKNPKNNTDFLDLLENSIKSINIDEEIELHRQGNDYKQNFTIRESLEDFEEWKNNLEEILEQLKK